MRDSSAPRPGLPASLGKYRVLGLLGEGSMGMVFLAHDPVLERNVAIKVMSGSSVGDAKLRERFEREAKAIARLHHPNIVTVHDLGYEDRGSPFIAMELLEGSDLHDLTEARPLPLGQKLEIVMQVCRGLAHAHGNGIVHRDIKPANIFVVRDGTAKIMDFGVSRWMQTTQTQAGLVVGTAGYISPEQLRGKGVDERTDLFSLGVVLFEILTNDVLFSGDTIEAIFFKTLGRETPALVAPNGQELPALQAIVQRALAKDADARYRSAEEMGEALRSFADTHHALLGESAPFTTRERAASPAGSGSRPPKAPTRVARPTATIPPSAIHRRIAPAHSVPRPRSRSYRVFFAAGIAVVLLAAAIGGHALLVEKPLTSSSPPRAAAPPEPEPPLPREEGASLVADAALALGNGSLDQAQELIERGEKIDPGNARWGALRGQLEQRRAQADKRRLASRHVEEGRNALARGSAPEAIAAFTRAMESDPGNEDARSGLDRAVALASRPVEAPNTNKAPSPDPQRKFVESRTQFAPGASGSGELMGFEAEPGIEVGETKDPFFPAQILLDLSPPDARPGESYALRVSLFNEGYRAVALRSLELVSRFEGKTSGQGQPIPLLVTEVAPQATVRIYEVSGTWKEALNHGEIEATVTLENGATLTKTLRW